MAENLQTSDSPERWAPPPRRGALRRFVYPLLVIAAIAAVIWYLEYRGDGGGYSPTGERYGPTDLPAGMAPAGTDVAPQPGALAPDFLLEQLTGGELRLSDLRGRPVVLNFWATWCAPCRKEMPQFVQAYDRYQDQGLVIVAVNLQEGKGIVRPFADDFGIKFPIAIDRDGEVGDRYRLLGLPTTFFIGRDGVVRSVFTGPFLEKQRGTNVQSAIAEDELDGRIAQILTAPGP
ncbi:MAG: redoxin domain-containing protein [Dehalococcoidia bacterium]|nr:redoxin domain-containing protein [Dehalococcoidia bacterium]